MRANDEDAHVLQSRFDRSLADVVRRRRAAYPLWKRQRVSVVSQAPPGPPARDDLRDDHIGPRVIHDERFELRRLGEVDDTAGRSRRSVASDATTAKVLAGGDAKVRRLEDTLFLCLGAVRAHIRGLSLRLVVVEDGFGDQVDLAGRRGRRDFDVVLEGRGRHGRLSVFFAAILEDKAHLALGTFRKSDFFVAATIFSLLCGNRLRLGVGGVSPVVNGSQA